MTQTLKKVFYSLTFMILCLGTFNGVVLKKVVIM